MSGWSGGSPLRVPTKSANISETPFHTPTSEENAAAQKPTRNALPMTAPYSRRRMSARLSRELSEDSTASPARYSSSTPMTRVAMTKMPVTMYAMALSSRMTLIQPADIQPFSRSQ